MRIMPELYEKRTDTENHRGNTELHRELIKGYYGIK
jgi:hypothetical protein